MSLQIHHSQLLLKNQLSGSTVVVNNVNLVCDWLTVSVIFNLILSITLFVCTMAEKAFGQCFSA